MLLLGLTGSIASGKSTVSTLLSQPPYSLPIIDADLLARQVVAPGSPGLNAIVKHFGPSILAADGSLDRPALGRRVFGSPADLKVLNSITHPLVRKEIYKGVLRAYLSGAWAVVLDVPLLFESGMELMCGGVIVVEVGKDVQMERLMGRDGARVTEEEAKKRVESQMSSAEKKAVGDKVMGGRCWGVDNNGSRQELERNVERALAEIRRGREGWWSWLMLAVPPLAMGVGAWVMFGNWLRKRELNKRKMAEKAKL